MNTEITDNKRLMVFYDGTCAFCTRWAQRGRAWLGIRFEPFANGRAEGEMKVLTAAGTTLGGVEAIAYLCRQVWWLWPVWVVSRLPGMGRVYRWVAANRHCLNGNCDLGVRRLGGAFPGERQGGVKPPHSKWGKGAL